jgi:hypothetical protein
MVSIGKAAYAAFSENYVADANYPILMEIYKKALASI